MSIPILTHCDNCEQRRLCRRYKSLSLCLHGKGGCYRLRRGIHALRQRALSHKALAEYHRFQVWQRMGDLM